MASKSNEGAQEGALPPAVIAQAEAAIIGNLEDTPPGSRRPSRAGKPDYSEYQASNQQPSSAQPVSSRPAHLAVPNDVSEAPPAYGDRDDELEVNQDGLLTKAKVTDDGRVNISINQKTRKLSDLLVPALRNQLSLVAQEDSVPLPSGYIPPALGGAPGQVEPPRLNVVVHVVGSRGDVQPFVALGKTLKGTYGHRVRVATHPTFKEFVEENGLEFFSIGGDPSELMAFMVKNPGLMPGLDSLKSGDVGKRRKGMEEIVLGCWRSCIEAGDGLSAPPSKESFEENLGINMDANPSARPFIADAIIANPPSFAHIHIAEKMGIPLHMMFTMPWSPTQSFPHPLANIQSSNADVNMTNFISYALVEMMTWQGLGDVINRFRERALGLDPISLIWAPGMLSRLRVPYTYCWSPALIPKPKDWGKHISISGFYFLSLASSFTPEPDLAAFLADGPPPVYIGFGSIVVDDPNAMTKMIFEAVKKSGVRALVSKGWGGLGADALGIPEGVFMLGNVPHDWLFKHVSCVVHHGGAGTTAAGIALGRPTVVVPFFGDQPFWGAMVARAGAGPPAIPYKQLTADKLAEALAFALKPETLAKAGELGAKIKEELGTETGGKSFHDNLDLDRMRCSLFPSKVAVWRIKRTQTRLSAMAANILASEDLISFADLKLYRPREYETDDGPWDPISGGASALLGTIASLGMGVADFPIEIFRKINRAKDSAQKSSGTETSSGAQTPATSESSRATSDTLAGTSSQSSTPTKTSYESSTDASTNDPSVRSSARSATVSGSDMGQTTPINSMKQALRGTLSRSRSCSRERNPGSRSNSPIGLAGGIRREVDPSKLTIENAIGAGKGISRIVGAGMKSPMDFTLGIARGFHNAPKLYGDDTVRPQEKVTDFQSGLKAAGKEFGFGFYDGITGLITQPLRGAEQEGAAGLMKGIGKGIGGLILKPGAAIWGLPGYAFLGIHKEVRKLFGSSVLNYIISARTAQGYEDAQKATPEERQYIINQFKTHKSEYVNAKQTREEASGQESGKKSPRGFWETRHLSFDERKKLQAERKAKRGEEGSKVQNENGTSTCPFCRRTEAHSHAPQLQVPQAAANTTEAPNLEFEHAIHASVAATSRGNAEEDLVIERAIRASVRELQSANANMPGAQLDDREALDRAIRASIASAGERERNGRGGEEDAEHERALEEAIQRSLSEYRTERPREEQSLMLGEVDEVEEDENVRLALRRSRQAAQGSTGLDGMTEEERVVLEYVKKQSIAEEAHRKRMLEGKVAGSSGSAPRPSVAAGGEVGESGEGAVDADEEALRLALEESLK